MDWWSAQLRTAPEHTRKLCAKHRSSVELYRAVEPLAYAACRAERRLGQASADKCKRFMMQQEAALQYEQLTQDLIDTGAGVVLVNTEHFWGMVEEMQIELSNEPPGRTMSEWATMPKLRVNDHLVLACDSGMGVCPDARTLPLDAPLKYMRLAPVSNGIAYGPEALAKRHRNVWLWCSHCGHIVRMPRTAHLCIHCHSGCWCSERCCERDGDRHTDESCDYVCETLESAIRKWKGRQTWPFCRVWWVVGDKDRTDEEERRACERPPSLPMPLVVAVTDPGPMLSDLSVGLSHAEREVITRHPFLIKTMLLTELRHYQDAYDRLRASECQLCNSERESASSASQPQAQRKRKQKQKQRRACALPNDVRRPVSRLAHDMAMCIYAA